LKPTAATPPAEPIPNVLAERYASSAMQEIWSAHGRILLERDFWIAVMKAQRDLGGGTGALAEAVAEVLPLAEVEIWDIDRAMLGVARERCARFGARIRYVERSFAEPLTPCDAVVACIALHHVKDLTVKGAIYRNIHTALKPGGVFMNADLAVAAGGTLHEFSYAEWIRAMAPHDINEAQARAHFASWAHEDYYPPLLTEMQLLADGGFADPECFWREIPCGIFGGMK